MSKPTGWQRQFQNRDGINLPKESVRPAGPTQWEQLLREYNLKESEALLVLRSGGKTAAELRNWIARHREMVYVPEYVLKELRIPTRWA